MFFHSFFMILVLGFVLVLNLVLGLVLNWVLGLVLSLVLNWVAGLVLVLNSFFGCCGSALNPTRRCDLSQKGFV